MSTFKNFVQCRVTTPITAAANSIGLYAAVPPYSLPSEEGGLLVLTDSPTKPSKLEVISYTSRSALGLYGVTRGLEGTTALEWTGPVYCYQSLLAGEFKTLLDSKVDKAAGKQLSDENYTSPEKAKLAGIQAGAQVNAVTTVSGRSGAVTLAKGDVGLSNVDNTSDINKPVSTATSTALSGKVDKVTGKGLSENDYTIAEKTKLAGVASEATKNRADSDNADKVHAHSVEQVTGLGTAATATLTTSNTDGTAGRVLKVGDGGWMGQGVKTETPLGYPASADDVTNKTKVICCEVVDNGVNAYVSGIHFAAHDTWGRLRVFHTTPRAWIQGGVSHTGIGWTSQVVLSDNLLQTPGSLTDFPMSQKATTDAIANIPSVPKLTTYTVTVADKGASIDTTANVTIPASVFAVGDVIVVTNTGSSNITITPVYGSTIRLAGTTSSGTRTLAGNGVATLRMVFNNVWFASGAGLS